MSLAEARPGRVILVYKADVLPKSDGLFLKACQAVSAEHPQVQVDDLRMDATAA